MTTEETQETQDKREKIDIVAWIWRVMGTTVIGTLLVLIMTIFNHLSDRVSCCERTLSEARSQVGEIKGELEATKKTTEKLEKFILQVSTSYKDADKEAVQSLQAFQKDIQVYREKVVVLEQQVKSLEEKIRMIEAKSAKIVEKPEITEKKS
jgi:chromosome segregation ATPase